MKSAAILIVLCMFLHTLTGLAQYQVESNGSEDVLQARLIKINRMSVSWQNEPIELKLNTGSNCAGKFIALRNSMFRLQVDDGVREVPLKDVDTIVLKRKPQDLLLVGLTAVGIAALFAGSASLGFDASDQEIAGASAVGAAVGVVIGWRAFYQNVEIRLK